jgi:hypothetical protein
MDINIQLGKIIKSVSTLGRGIFLFTYPSNNTSLICQKVVTVCQCHCDTNNIEKCDIYSKLQN